MRKIVITMLVFLFVGLSANAQKYFTREGHIHFYSETPIETIEADNNSATCVLDTESGKMEFAVLIKGFQFEKALMQEHFNENYMESSKFPKSTFKGQIDNVEEVNFSEDGEYPVKVSGNLTIHGETNEVSTEGTIIVKGEEIGAKSKFVVEVADYKIEIPSVVRENIAKEIEIDVDVSLEEFKK